MESQERSPSSRNTERALQVVAAVQAYLDEGAWKRKPADLKGTTFFGRWDLWFYIAISDPATCWTCELINGSVFMGIDLRLLFPYNLIVDSDQILPMVHPNCRCTLLRVTDLNDYLPLTTGGWYGTGGEPIEKLVAQLVHSKDSCAMERVRDAGSALESTKTTAKPE